MAEKPEQPRKLVWLVDSLNRLAGFPTVVRQKLGFALYQAQIGQTHESAKMLRGFKETVWQVHAGRDISGSVRGTVRGSGLRAARFPEEVDVRIATPQRELELIQQRLQLARNLAGK